MEPRGASLARRRRKSLRHGKAKPMAARVSPGSSEIPPRPPQAINCLCRWRGSVGSKAAGIKCLPTLRSDAREAARKNRGGFGPKKKRLTPTVERTGSILGRRWKGMAPGGPKIATYVRNSSFFNKLFSFNHALLVRLFQSQKNCKCYSKTFVLSLSFSFP